MKKPIELTEENEIEIQILAAETRLSIARMILKKLKELRALYKESKTL